MCNFGPIGSYALDEMSYEIGKKNGTPAVAVELTYCHSRSDIRGIVKLGSPQEVEGTVLKALENLDARKVLLVANYETLDIQQLVQNLSQTYPQSIMECPQTAMDTYGAGSSRVVELTFTYENSNDALRQMRTQVGAVFDSSSLYVSGDGADSQKFGQLYSFLMDRFHYTLETSITPAYSLLRHGVGDSRAFATVYAAMCRAAGLDCQIVTGTRDAGALDLEPDLRRRHLLPRRPDPLQGRGRLPGEARGRYDRLRVGLLGLSGLRAPAWLPHWGSCKKTS